MAPCVPVSPLFSVSSPLLFSLPYPLSPPSLLSAPLLAQLHSNFFPLLDHLTPSLVSLGQCLPKIVRLTGGLVFAQAIVRLHVAFCTTVSKRQCIIACILFVNVHAPVQSFEFPSVNGAFGPVLHELEGWRSE
eukprot:2987099-Rhodomonas_salina.4